MIHGNVYSYLKSARQHNGFLALSVYTLPQIEAAIAEAEQLQAREDALMARVEAALGNMSWINGFASKDHERLNALVSGDNGGYVIEVAHKDVREIFPLSKWSKINKQHGRWLDKVEKALLTLPELQTA